MKCFQKASLLKNHQECDSRSGFSLLEVLVSFAVLTLTLVMLLETFSGGTWRFSHAREVDEMNLIAQNQLAIIKTKPQLIDGEQQHGKTDRFRWEILSKLIQTGDGNPDFGSSVFKVRVKVVSLKRNSKTVQIESFLVKRRGKKQ